MNDGLVEELQKGLVNEKYSIMGNEKIKEGDCVLEWKNGKAENIWKNRKNEIENILLKCREV